MTSIDEPRARAAHHLPGSPHGGAAPGRPSAPHVRGNPFRDRACHDCALPYGRYLHLHVHPVAAELGRVRREVRSVLSSWDCPPSVIDDCVLLCSELVANAVTHAAAGSIGVSLLQAGERLLLEVTDVSAKHPVVRHADPDDEQGRGMLLVQEIAAAWGSCREPNGRKTTWCTLLPPPAGDPSSGA